MVSPPCYSGVSLCDIMIIEAMLAGASAPGRVTQVRQVQDECPDEKRHPGLPGWGLLQWASSSLYKNSFTAKRPNNNNFGPTLRKLLSKQTRNMIFWVLKYSYYSYYQKTNGSLKID